MHEEMDFSFLDSTGLYGSYQLDHQSVYTDTGLMKHDVSITEYMDDGSHQLDKTTCFPPSSLIVPLSTSNTESASSANSRKRKATSESTTMKKISPNQEE